MSPELNSVSKLRNTKKYIFRSFAALALGGILTVGGQKDTYYANSVKIPSSTLLLPDNFPVTPDALQYGPKAPDIPLALVIPIELKAGEEYRLDLLQASKGIVNKNAQMVGINESSVTAQSLNIWQSSLQPCGGDLPPCWVKERESHGNYSVVNKTGCSGRTCGGAWQFDPITWNGFDGYKFAQDAPPAVQDQKARLVWNNGNGCSNWDAC